MTDVRNECECGRDMPPMMGAAQDSDDGGLAWDTGVRKVSCKHFDNAWEVRVTDIDHPLDDSMLTVKEWEPIDG